MSRARAGSFAVVGLLAVPLGACTARVSVSSDEVQGDGASHNPSISESGRYVAFESQAGNLVPGKGPVFVRDLAAGTTVGVGPGSGSQPEISANGRYVAFVSFSRLTPDDTGEDQDLFVWDRETGITTRASVGFGGREGNANAVVPGGSIAISRSGRYVAFESTPPTSSRATQTGWTTSSSATGRRARPGGFPSNRPASPPPSRTARRPSGSPIRC